MTYFLDIIDSFSLYALLSIINACVMFKYIWELLFCWKLKKKPNRVLNNYFN